MDSTQLLASDRPASCRVTCCCQQRTR